MILWILLIGTIIGLVIFNKSYSCEELGLTLALIFGMFAIGALIIAGVYNIAPDAQKVALETQQSAIEYELDSGIYNDEFGMLDKDVVGEIKKWNSDLIMYKAWQRNFWIGVFIPNIYDDLELIDYSRVKPQGN